MQKKQLGNLAVIILTLLNVAIWLIFPPPDQLPTNNALQFWGEITSSTAMILMSITFVLAARPRFLEPFFGGLDKMFQTHKQVSMLAFLLLVVHFFVIPDSGELVAGKPLGMLAFLGIIILILITIAPRVPLISRFLNLAYHKWRISHKLLGVFFIVGLVHYIMVDTISKQTVPGSYMLLLSLIGIIAFIYRQFFSRMFEPYRDYVVERVNHLNATCVELYLKPKGKKVKFEAGQFVYVYFKGGRELREPHPFTVSSSPQEETLRLTIKGSGDWTRYLVKNLKAGTDAAVHGGFGMFNYKDGGSDQIWIAGGIGVTPFVSWVRDLNGKLDADVDFYYGVHSEGDALFLNEFQTAAQKHANFNVNVQYALRDGNLSAEQIASQSNGAMVGKHIYMCGPAGMMESFATQFKQAGVPAQNIHYEEFNLR
ncbi:MAG: hypothetical protein GY805_28715 [Chloroflexi bacterium]|nr:hypothetical protein [Chloroflexota bacterium]